ncbi:MAG: hypothetical protein AAF907_16170, partial [Planctomycetota bacterium]
MRRSRPNAGRLAASARPRLACGAVAVAILSLCGCASDDAAVLRGDLLRATEELTRTQAELRDARADLAAAERSADELRAQVADGSGVVVASAEQVRALGRVTQLRFSKMLTGGLDRDGAPGEETLAVVLAPADADGAPIKTAGALSLELIDLGAESGGRLVGSWSFSPADIAESWRSTAIGVGFRFRLPLEPRATLGAAREELHLVARLETRDGRRFSATHPVRINR